MKYEAHMTSRDTYYHTLRLARHPDDTYTHCIPKKIMESVKTEAERGGDLFSKRSEFYHI
jgi:hypothetical protein